MAFLLFLITNWIGKHSLSFGYIQLSLFVRADEAPAFNLVFRVLTPVVYVLIVSSVFYATGLDIFITNIFLVVIYYFVFRLIFNIATGRSRLLNWPMQFLQLALSCSIAWLAYRYLVVEKSHLLPDFSSLANELWIAIIGFLYLLFNRVRVGTTATERRKRTYLHHRYQLYKRKYDQTIKTATSDSKLEALIYAVLIYEAFNRPKAYRLLENLVFPLGLSESLGIMQVRTDSYISDEESVGRGAELIVREYAAASATLDASIERRMKESRVDRELVARIEERQLLRKVLLKYNPSAQYASEVERLHEMILREFYLKATADTPNRAVPV